MFFKKPSFYVKLYKNKAEVINIDTSVSISKIANKPFSNSRSIIADYNTFELFLRELIHDVGINPKQKDTFNLLIQVMEKYKDDLSMVEKRALLDSGENIGGKLTKLYLGNYELSLGQARSELNK